MSIVIVSSPAPCHPSTELIDYVIQSLNFMKETNECDIFIVLDGYKISDSDAHVKQGRVTADRGAAYEEYIVNLRAKYEGDPSAGIRKYHLICSPEHIGFAMCVKLGLEMVSTKYCLILQHDRIFVSPFNHICSCVDVFEQHSHVRYIGFPSSCNKNHESTMLYRYDISPLVYTFNENINPMIHLFLPVPESDSQLTQERIRLQPLMFW